MQLDKVSSLFEFFIFSINKNREELVPEITGTIWETDYFEYQKEGSVYQFKGKEEIKNANQNDIIEFRPNGVLYSTFVGMGTWTRTGNKVFMTYKTGNDIIHDAYILNRNTLTYTEEGTICGDISFNVNIRYTKRIVR